MVRERLTIKSVGKRKDARIFKKIENILRRKKI
jgi:hypothetical protein